MQMKLRAYFRKPWHGMKIIFGIIFLVAAGLCLTGKEFENLPGNRLQVEPQGDLTQTWQIRQAELEETYNHVWGILQIQNVSSTTVRTARFYAEYFDAKGRRCFMLQFDQNLNREKRNSRFEPDEVRTLQSFSYSLNPGIEPKKIKVFVISQDPPSQTQGMIQPVVMAPVTLRGVQSGEWERLWLGQELESATGPFLDLVLAQVAVGPEGDLKELKILNAVNPWVENWFTSYVHHLDFGPAMRAGVPVKGGALLLVRAGVSTQEIRDPLFLPRESILVKSFIESIKNEDIPPVEDLLFVPSSKEYWAQPGPGYFRHSGSYSTWSSDQQLFQGIELQNQHRK